jgi:hypothetical protein
VLKRLIFWEFPRTTWQYDVVVGLILAFIFLTPRSVFNDQPRAPGVVRLPAYNGAGVFFIEAALLKGATPEALTAEAAAAVSRRIGRKAEVARVLPVVAEGEQPAGYMVYLKP